MQRLVAWGNNVGGAIDPKSHDVKISDPYDLTGNVDCDEVLWHGWACSILKNRSTGRILAIGTDEIITDATRIQELHLPEGLQRVIGFDRPVAFLDGSSYLADWSGRRSSGIWAEVAVTQLGSAIAWSSQAGLIWFSSLDALMDGSSGIPLRHARLRHDKSCRLVATESRAFALQESEFDPVFEIVTNRGGRPCPPTPQPVQGLEGAGALTLVSGANDRLGLVSEAGQSYMLNKGSISAEPCEYDDDIRLLGVLAHGTIAVGEARIWLTGESKYGELGYQPQQAPEQTSAADSFLLRDDYAEPRQIVAINSSRWSTIMTVTTDR